MFLLRISNIIVDHINDVTDIFRTNAELHIRTADPRGKKNDRISLFLKKFKYVATNFISRHTLS